MNPTKRTFRSLFREARKTLTYRVEGLALDFTEQVLARMEAMGLSRAQLAEKMNHSGAYVTKLLRGAKNNLTFESVVKVANALDSELKIYLVPKAPAQAWADQMGRQMPEQTNGVDEWRKLKHNLAPPGDRLSGGFASQQFAEYEAFSART